MPAFPRRCNQLSTMGGKEWVGQIAVSRGGIHLSQLTLLPQRPLQELSGSDPDRIRCRGHVARAGPLGGRDNGGLRGWGRCHRRPSTSSGFRSSETGHFRAMAPAWAALGSGNTPANSVLSTYPPVRTEQTGTVAGTRVTWTQRTAYRPRGYSPRRRRRTPAGAFTHPR